MDSDQWGNWMSLVAGSNEDDGAEGTFLVPPPVSRTKTGERYARSKDNLRHSNSCCCLGDVIASFVAGLQAPAGCQRHVGGHLRSAASVKF